MLQPPFRIALGVQCAYRFALLLDPRVILEVVPAGAVFRRPDLYPIGADAVEYALDAAHCRRRVKLTEAVAHVGHHAVIAIQGIRGNRSDHVAFAEAEVFSRLYRAQDVANPADAEQRTQLFDGCTVHAVPISQRLPPNLHTDYLFTLLPRHISHPPFHTPR